MATSTRASVRARKKCVRSRAQKKRASARVPKRHEGSPGEAKRNPGQSGKRSRVSLHSTRATGPTRSARKKAATRKTERADVVVLDGRRLSRRIEFTGRLTDYIRRRYVEAGEGADVIARSVGVAKATIQRLIREQDWTRAGDGPRDLSRAEQLEAEARTLAAKAGAGRATDAGATLPPRSGGEGRFVARQRNEPGWGALAVPATASGAEALLPPTPDPSPPFAARTGGGENGAEPHEQGAAPSAHDAAPLAQDAAPSVQDAPHAQDMTIAQDAAPVDVGEQIERLLRLVSAEIGVYEALRATLQREPQGQREAQKTAHNIASLTATLETLRRMRAAQTVTASHDDTDDDIPADIDEFREALARRIDAFVASRMDAGDAGADDAEGSDRA